MLTYTCKPEWTRDARANQITIDMLLRHDSGIGLEWREQGKILRGEIINSYKPNETEKKSDRKVQNIEIEKTDVFKENM